MRRAPVGCLLAAMMLAGCLGLPTKQEPVTLPHAAPLTPVPGAVAGAWPTKEWWQRYQDATLDRLIEIGIESSPTLDTAHTRFESARQSVRVVGAASGIQVGLEADASRQRLSENGLFPPELLGFTWYNQTDLGLQISYTFDFWGKQRAIIDAAIDQAHAAQAERSAAALMLASSIADSYFGWQADQSRLSLAREHLDALERERAITRARVAAELEPADTLSRADGELAAARDQIAALEGSAQLRVIALAALVGKPASDLPPLTPQPLPAVEAGLPDDVRIDLIARRADITASRWRVEAAERTLDSARADYLPDITINALAGLSSIEFGKLLEWQSRVPELGAALHLPLFDSGRIKARYGASEVQIRSAVAAYQETLVEAARDVATQAATRRQLEAQRVQRQLEVDAAQKLKSSAAARVRQGLTDERTEIAANDSLIAQRDALLQIDAAALSADIGLQRALGGGYEAPPRFGLSTDKSSKAAP